MGNAVKDSIDRPATLTRTRIKEGVWEGILSGVHGTPALAVRLDGADVAGLSVTRIPDRDGDWAVRLAIPATVLTEGVQTFLILDRATGDKLANFTIITGVAMEDDLRAEVDLLRAELDLLKRAFRRHCVETGG